MITDYGKSIRARLLNLSKKEKLDYMKVLIRYIHERLLYRISTSKYQKNFLLKGSSLIFAYDMFKSRPTIDVDLLGANISNEKDNIKSIFEEICKIDCKEDGVRFLPETIKITPIALEKKYPGNCVKITAKIDTIIQNISIDIGYGDVVTPHPLPLEYPTLLNDIPQVELYAYSLETLIAEKFHAMIVRDTENSRMKDFFDVYTLFKNHNINEDLLKEAIINTFNARETKYSEGKALFTQTFTTDETRNQMWNIYLKSIHWPEKFKFEVVMDLIKSKLQTYWTKEFLG